MSSLVTNHASLCVYVCVFVCMCDVYVYVYVCACVRARACESTLGMAHQMGVLNLHERELDWACFHPSQVAVPIEQKLTKERNLLEQ